MVPRCGSCPRRIYKSSRRLVIKKALRICHLSGGSHGNSAFGSHNDGVMKKDVRANATDHAWR